MSAPLLSTQLPLCDSGLRVKKGERVNDRQDPALDVGGQSPIEAVAENAASGPQVPGQGVDHPALVLAGGQVALCPAYLAPHWATRRHPEVYYFYA